ncbi:hypothetical protein GCM10007870_19860 [Gluconobacter kondonii]|uniref:Uncharacterized protein n=1 Tax=Gluconobacter kondonii TaxID=941463 RepID=A0ABQ5WSB8_9PROT|nr:hypothetical protein AA3266_2113 [Gluconobacter kondonii NBRC 3266]GLQ66402.1 hypothetical protein GCM10007870_19860 [Gluconobacter kondonii]
MGKPDLVLPQGWRRVEIGNDPEHGLARRFPFPEGVDCPDHSQDGEGK